MLSVCLVDELEAPRRKLIYEKGFQLAGNALARNQDVQCRSILHAFLGSVGVKAPQKIIRLQAEKDLCQRQHLMGTTHRVTSETLNNAEKYDQEFTCPT
jgi:hypothetical protein